MDMNQIIGHLFSGFACKFYAVGMAAWMAYEAAMYILTTFAAVTAAFPA